MRGGDFVRQTSQSVLALYVWLWDARMQPDSFSSIPLRAKNTRQKKHSQTKRGRARQNKKQSERRKQGAFQAPGPLGLISHTGLIQ